VGTPYATAIMSDSPPLQRPTVGMLALKDIPYYDREAEQKRWIDHLNLHDSDNRMLTACSSQEEWEHKDMSLQLVVDGVQVPVPPACATVSLVRLGHRPSFLNLLPAAHIIKGKLWH
jgi:hypothetical protein